MSSLCNWQLMVMFLHYYASLIYFLTSDITVTS